MKFEEYLERKKIDSVQFRKEEKQLYEDWKSLYEQVHPNSFTTQKKFLINEIRRRFLLAEKPKERKTESTDKNEEKSQRRKINLKGKIKKPGS